MTAKPFVKWVGGKSQLLGEIEKKLPTDLASRQNVTYVEPFVGGGAVLFWVLQRYPNIKQAIINDINPHLITTYLEIKHHPTELIVVLGQLQNEYLKRSDEERKAFYLQRRDEFNYKRISNLERAALFIFLNKTCFNGLYRVNSKGLFNVPHGRYANPKICDSATIVADSLLLQRVEILCGDFAQTDIYAGKDALFYFDPPYKPISSTSSFTSYSKEGFGDADQIRLRDFCHQIARFGSDFILSNSDAKINSKEESDFFDELYKPFAVQRVLASRMINSKADRRGKLFEVLISNIKIQQEHQLFINL